MKEIKLLSDFPLPLHDVENSVYFQLLKEKVSQINNVVLPNWIFTKYELLSYRPEDSNNIKFCELMVQENLMIAKIEGNQKTYRVQEVCLQYLYLLARNRLISFAFDKNDTQELKAYREH